MASSAATLRIYHPADFEILYRIDQACFPKGIAYGRNDFKLYLRSPGAHCLLAEIGEPREVAGFILTARRDALGHVITLDVLKRYRRLAIGSLLLDSAEREIAAQGSKQMVLETATANKAGIAFWNKHGYREFGIVVDYYGLGLHAFRMHKTLSGMH